LFQSKHTTHEHDLLQTGAGIWQMATEQKQMS